MCDWQHGIPKRGNIQRLAPRSANSIIHGKLSTDCGCSRCLIPVAGRQLALLYCTSQSLHSRMRLCAKNGAKLNSIPEIPNTFDTEDSTSCPKNTRNWNPNPPEHSPDTLQRHAHTTEPIQRWACSYSFSSRFRFVSILVAVRDHYQHLVQVAVGAELQRWGRLIQLCVHKH